VNKATQHSDRPAAAVPLGGPWTLRTREAGGGTRSWVTAACTGCGTVPWDEPLGLPAAFPTLDHARRELPRDWGWTVTIVPGAAEVALCPRCAAP